MNEKIYESPDSGETIYERNFGETEKKLIERKKVKYIVETFSTFREVHIVEAENEEIAKKIAGNSDYNMSIWLGQQVATIYPYSKEHEKRFRAEEPYFYDAVKGVDAEGYLTYQKPGEEPVRSSYDEKIL